MKKTSYLILFVLTIFTFACQPKKNEPTKLELLTSKKWKLIAATVNPPLPGTIPISDYYNNGMLPCEKDDIISFNTSGAYTRDEGVTKCTNTDPQIVNGIWVFSNNENNITITEDQISFNYNIFQLDSTTLKVGTTINIGGIDYTFTFTYTAQ